MKRLILVFFVLIFFMACNRNASEKGIIERDKMISLLTDVHLVDGYLAGLWQGDTIKQVAANYYTLIYERHFTDSIQFKRSLKYYSAQPKLLDSMYNQVVANLDKLQKDEESRIEKKKLDTDRYYTLRAETNGTLFKPYDVWFYKFASDSYPKSLLKPIKPNWFKPYGIWFYEFGEESLEKKKSLKETVKTDTKADTTSTKTDTKAIDTLKSDTLRTRKFSKFRSLENRGKYIKNNRRNDLSK